jgi:hypothetical protein
LSDGDGARPGGKGRDASDRLAKELTRACSILLERGGFPWRCLRSRQFGECGAEHRAS